MTLAEWSAVASIVTTFATVITMGVLIWYTIETYRLRTAAELQHKAAVEQLNETKIQTDLSITPVLTISADPDPSPQTGVAIVMRNLGTGAAFDIGVEPEATEGIRLRFEYPDVLASQEIAQITLFWNRGDKGSGKLQTVSDYMGMCKSHRIPDFVYINLVYIGATKKSYRTRCQFVCEGGNDRLRFVTLEIWERVGDRDLPLINRPERPS